ncbi:MAG: NB-ARC domain-containing protein [Cyanobacteria bacterium P01_G01_bin.39]
MSYSRRDTWRATFNGIDKVNDALAVKGLNKVQLVMLVEEKLSEGEIGFSRSKKPSFSRSTLDRFLSKKYRKSITANRIRAICEVLDLDINTIVERNAFPVEIKQQVDENNDKNNTDINRSVLFKKLETVPDISDFAHRKNEVKEIIHKINNHKNLIIVSGSPGVGKSYLIAKVLEIIKQEERFEGYIWKSIRYGVKVKDLVSEIVNLVPSSKKFKNTSEDFKDEGIYKLIELLNHHKIFLVLENWEDLFKNNEISGYYKNEYEKYNHLLDKLAGTETQSCVVITTSQKPKNIKKSRLVHLLCLQGFDFDEVQGIFANSNMILAHDELISSIEMIINIYQGNPFVVNNIINLFHKNNNFDDYYLLVEDWIQYQYNLTSEIEKEILLCLTLNNGQVHQNKFLSEIENLRIHALNSMIIRKSIHSLKRRFLIEINSDREIKLNLYLLHYLINYYSSDYLNTANSNNPQNSSGSVFKMINFKASNRAIPTHKEIKLKIKKICASNDNLSEKISQLFSLKVSLKAGK